MTRNQCWPVTLPDGQNAVISAPEPPDEDTITAVQVIVDRLSELWCPAVSDVPTPGPIIGRTYPCGRRRGHDGPHRWPADTGSYATWEDNPHA